MHMKSLLIFVPALIFLLLTSCNKDIDLTGKHEETPVVYALLDQNDSLHYVKVTRTFAGSNNALNVAQIADSSYFQDVKITMEEWGNIGSNSQKIRTWILRDTVISGKEQGVFYNPTQKVYYFVTKRASSVEPPTSDANTLTALKSACTYKMKIEINGGEIVVNGSTTLTSGINVVAPNAAGSFTFVKYINGEKQYQNANVRVSNGNSKVIDLRFEIFIKEYFNGVPVEKSFVWKIGEVLDDQVEGVNTNFNINGNSFYNVIKSNITNDASIDKREFTRIRIYTTGGSEDLAKYIQMTKPSTSLAQNKITKVFGLSRADDGPLLGIFSSRSTTFVEKLKYNPFFQNQRALDKNSMEELCIGPITGSYLFCSDNIIDNTQSWYCQ